MKYIFICIFIYLSSLSYGQDMIVDWGECFGANYSNSYGRAIEVLPNESIVTTIVVTDYNEAFTDYHGDADAWVLILDNTGNIVNDKCFGGGAEDVFQDIEVYDDYIYFIGYTQSTDGDVQSEPIGGYVDLWVVKTDFDLNIIWERRYGCLGTQQFESAKVTEEGGLVLLMDFFGSGGGDVSQYYGDTDIWVCKIDANGDILWEKTLGNTEGNYASNVLLTEDNKTIIIGETNYSGGMVECNCHGMRDIWVIELDNNTQEILWQGCYGGSENDAAVSILKDNSDYLIVGGTRSSDGDILSFNHGEGDAWVFQIDSGGQLVWERCFGGSGGEHIKKIYKTEDNGYFLFGVTSSEDGDVNNTNCPYPFCRTSAWVIELDSAKNMLWNGTHGSYDYSYYKKNGIKRVGERDFIIAGIVGDQGTHLGDVDCDPYPIKNGYSAWIYRFYDPNVGLDNLFSSSLKTYPNPAINQVFIELPEHSGNAEIKILDIFGNSITQLKAYNKQTQILWDCSNVTRGVYFYQTEIGDMVYRGKVLVNK